MVVEGGWGRRNDKEQRLEILKKQTTSFSPAKKKVSLFLFFFKQKSYSTKNESVR